MDKIIKKILAMIGFWNRVNPMVVDSVSTATKSLDKIIDKTQRDLETVIETKKAVKARVDESIKALEAEWEAAEDEADNAEVRLSKIKDVFGN